MRAAAGLAATAAGLALVLGSVPAARDGIERPPPGHTGGFGEPTCTVCHLPGAAQHAEGAISIDGVPDRYVAGASYEIRVTLVHPGLRAGGFQLSARSADGAQAGRLEPAATESGRIELTVDGGVEFAHHTWAGTRRSLPDTMRWVVRWTAPAGGIVWFHAAANAADDDESPLGDVIHAAARHALAPDSSRTIVPHVHFP